MIRLVVAALLAVFPLPGDPKAQPGFFRGDDFDGDGNAEATFEVAHDVTLANEISQALTSANGQSPPAAQTFVHDPAGNLVFDGQFFYQYDGLNRLCRVIRDPNLTAALLDPNTGRPPQNWGTSGTVVQFWYDGLGRLIRTTRTGGQPSSDHFYDGMRRIQDGPLDPNAANAVVREYVWGVGYVNEILAQVSRVGAATRQVYTYVQDASYNVVAILNSVGDAERQYVYEPYGEAVFAETAGGDPNTLVVNRIGHQGLFFERFALSPAETAGGAFVAPGALGVYLTPNRAYVPRLGRWLSRDMNESAQPVVTALAMNAQTLDLAFGAFSALGHYGDGMNLYAYAGANPVNRQDPLGLYDDPFEEVDDIIAGMAGERAAAALHTMAFFGAMGDLALVTASIAFHGTLAAIIPGYAVALGVYGSANAILDMQEPGGLNWWNVASFGLNFTSAAASLGPAMQQLGRVGSAAGRAFATAGARYAGMRMGRSYFSPGGRARLGICFAAGTSVWTPHGMEAIETIDVGERVLTSEWGFGGEGQPGLAMVHTRASGVGVAESDTSIVPDGWRLVTIDMPRADDSGDAVQVRTLRPVEWLVTAGCSPGQTFWFELPEMGLSGPAVVRSVGPCPPIEPGPGRVVLSTTVSCSETVLRLTLAGQDEPIELTALHRLFSEDRDDWVPAGELVRNERLRTLHGPAEIAEIASQPGVQTVYNLEVETEHWYFVSGAGVLSHNQNPCGAGYQGLKDAVYAWAKSKDIRNKFDCYDRALMIFDQKGIPYTTPEYITQGGDIAVQGQRIGNILTGTVY